MGKEDNELVYPVTTFDRSNLDPKILEEALKKVGFMTKSSWKVGIVRSELKKIYLQLAEQKAARKEQDGKLKEKKLERQSELRKSLQDLLAIGLDSTNNPYLDEYQDKATINGLDPNELNKKLGIFGGLDYEANFDVVENMRENQRLANHYELTHKQVVEPLQRIYNQYLDALFNPETSAFRGEDYKYDFDWQGHSYTISVSATVRSPYVVSPLVERRIDDVPTDLFKSIISPPQGMRIVRDDGKVMSLYGTNIHLIRDFGIYLAEKEYEDSPKEVPLGLSNIIDFFNLKRKLN